MRLNLIFHFIFCYQEGHNTTVVLKDVTELEAEEFYANPQLLEDSVRGIQAELTKAVNKYNTYRPHVSIDNLTPMQYSKILALRSSLVSFHMNPYRVDKKLDFFKIIV